MNVRDLDGGGDPSQCLQLFLGLLLPGHTDEEMMFVGMGLGLTASVLDEHHGSDVTGDQQ